MNLRRTIASMAALAPLLLAACSAPPDFVSESNGHGNLVGAPAPAPVEASPSPVPAPRPGTFRPAFAGDVAPGSLRWGAAIGGNADPARHESVTGRALGLRRTFFSWDKRTGSMVNTARADLAAGRVPWVSTKTPGWAEMASGARDAEIDQMLRALDALNGPVWLTVHHEPEGGGGSPTVDDPGGAPAWRAMQRRVRERMTALRTDNIAFAPILMTWTFDPRSGRTPSDWWVDGIWDFAGVDHYSQKESLTSMELAMWHNARGFYGAKGLKVAVGEWGNRGTDAAAAAEMEAFYRMAIGPVPPGQAQVIGMSYFDSNLNSPSGGWELFGAPLAKFRELSLQPTSIAANASS
jgi:hypothetical protein